MEDSYNYFTATALTFGVAFCVIMFWPGAFEGFVGMLRFLGVFP